jgi:hypothetical protein
MQRKPRHNPLKPQNMWGIHCPYDDGGACEAMMVGDPKQALCKGNKHSCSKVTYKKAAIYKSSRRLINENP